ncbi:hydroxymethylglutaryl-CoA lyase [Pedobacter sp. JY14-1]|uniref:hydroxymethylglutaryl-CoA lyase n=1 Tax=Pedobacter sp. JY14-1 TaxID=3034151 RepID=UPI0023E2CDED|nr:hydroxymethylglutaryl-CoA lyase [Pedobacter sp. JY14-1]
MGTNKIKLIECPRDAMQGIHKFIPTELKAEYLNTLLQVGFDTLDFGSFVSPRAVPQMQDTRKVLSRLDISTTVTRLLAIVANLRGAEEAAGFEEISYLGFPFSVSETFQQRNTNSSIVQSAEMVKRILELCDRNGKTAIVYISMGFGNPYGDPWTPEVVKHWMEQLVAYGVNIFALSDTTGESTPEKISTLLPLLQDCFIDTEIGLHLHSTPETSREKIASAYNAGCRRFDSALRGFGGCPMAKDELTGNLATEELISYLSEQGLELGLDMKKWQEAMVFSSSIFGP